jgi:hypothetical protein
MLVVRSGIPQGSLIGSLLFNFHDKFHVNDTVVLYHDKSFTSLHDKMNHDLRDLDDWFSQNGLTEC